METWTVRKHVKTQHCNKLFAAVSLSPKENVLTHEMGFARKVANRIIFMDDGQIVEENDPENFFNNAESDRLQLFLNQILTH